VRVDRRGGQPRRAGARRERREPLAAPEEQRDALNTLASRPTYANALLDAVADKRVQPSDISADIIRAIPLDLTCHTLRVQSVREEGKGKSRTEIAYSATIPYADRDILLLDDIVDTGITLNFLLDHIRENKPRSLKVCALIDKPGERKIDVHPDWSAFTLEKAPTDRFLVGYGLGSPEQTHRNLPYLAAAS
jgi:hypoxanthine phosphoribosyltransferase